MMWSDLCLQIQLKLVQERVSGRQFFLFYTKTHTGTSNKFAYITKTCLYNFEPLKPHFYLVKLGFTGVDIIFLICARKHRLWVLGESVLTSTHNLSFEQKHEKYHFLSEKFQLLEVKFSIYLNKRGFVMTFCGEIRKRTNKKKKKNHNTFGLEKKVLL